MLVLHIPTFGPIFTTTFFWPIRPPFRPRSPVYIQTWPEPFVFTHVRGRAIYLPSVDLISKLTYIHLGGVLCKSGRVAYEFQKR